MSAPYNLHSINHESGSITSRDISSPALPGIQLNNPNHMRKLQKTLTPIHLYNHRVSQIYAEFKQQLPSHLIRCRHNDEMLNESKPKQIEKQYKPKWIIQKPTRLHPVNKNDKAVKILETIIRAIRKQRDSSLSKTVLHSKVVLDMS